MFTGKIDIEGKCYNYTLDNFILTITDYTFISIGEDDEDFFKPLDIHKTKSNSFLNIYVIVERVLSSGSDGKIIKLLGYFSSYNEEMHFDRLTFTSKELDWFYNIRNGYSYKIDFPTGKASIELPAYFDTDKVTSFTFLNQLVDINLNFIRNIKNMDTSPIEIHTQLSFNFEETDNLEIALSFNDLVKKLLWFLTYRKNIDTPRIELKKKKDDGKYEIIGKLKLDCNKNPIVEIDKDIQERVINIELIEDLLKQIFEYVSSDKMYTYHIPSTLDDMSRITPARFILLMAAFEWEYKSIYNKKKTLKERLKEVYVDNLDTMEIFMGTLYRLSGLTYNIEEIAENLKNQRNNYAHGDISGIFVQNVILDLVTLEWLIYSMRLKDLGFDNDTIKAIINKLFDRKIAF